MNLALKATELRNKEIRIILWGKSLEIRGFPVRNGKVVIPPDDSPNTIAVAERHGINGNIALGIVDGIGLRQCAVASSVAHDCHNISVVGADLEDMAVAVNSVVESGGGFVAVEGGTVRHLVRFEIAGMITQAPYEEVIEKLTGFKGYITSKLGFNKDIDFIVL